jgi:hypothetical protein
VATLHVHVDESGELRFAPHSTRFYVFAAAWTYDPAPLAGGLTGVRFRLLNDGYDLDSFHAAEDKQVVRNAVVEEMLRHAGWKFAAVVVEKPRVNPSLYDPRRFYPRFASSVLRFVLRGCVKKGTTRIQIFTDALPNQTRGEAVEAAIKSACNADCKGLPFNVFHHPRQSNPWLQVVDYCAWATLRKWESNDLRTYDQLRPRLEAPELNAFAFGDGTIYYRHPKAKG